MTLFAASAFHSVAAGGDSLIGVHSAFLSLVTLTFDLDIQTRPSEGPNPSSLWISRKSVQRFPRYLIHKQKKLHTALKQNLAQFEPTAWDKYWEKHPIEIVQSGGEWRVLPARSKRRHETLWKKERSANKRTWHSTVISSVMLRFS